MSGHESSSWLADALSDDVMADVNLSIYVEQVIEPVYAKHHKEIEMLILSSSNYTHKDIAKALNVSRLGVTARINRAREILQGEFHEYIP